MGPLRGRDSPITDLAFKEHAAWARRRTRVRTASSTPPVAGREGQGEFSRNARPAPKVMGTTVSELQNPGHSKRRMGLSGSQAT